MLQNDVIYFIDLYFQRTFVQRMPSFHSFISSKNLTYIYMNSVVQCLTQIFYRKRQMRRGNILALMKKYHMGCWHRVNFYPERK